MALCAVCSEDNSDPRTQNSIQLKDLCLENNKETKKDFFDQKERFFEEINRMSDGN